MAVLIRLRTQLLAIVLAGVAGAPTGTRAESVAANDNRRPAGVLRGGALRVDLEAREGIWLPEGDEGPRLTVAAFGETGGPLSTPGPLLRVPQGTTVQVSIRNSLRVAIWVYGLGERRGIGSDSARIAPGETHAFRFGASDVGTYYYAARTGELPIGGRDAYDSQLHGGIVVDPPDVSTTPSDRVFVFSTWFRITPNTVSGTTDGVFAINGRSWPHTERFDVTQGDSLRWRMINLSVMQHPMHLHGFYFRVDAKGDGARDTIYLPAQRRLAVTEPVEVGQTARIGWSPDRGGNWIFHCHATAHVVPREKLEADRRMPAVAAESAHAAHAESDSGMPAHMAGMVMGIRVRARDVAQGDATADTLPARSLRLLMRSRANVYGEYAGFGYVLGGSSHETQRDSFDIPGPTLVLTRGQRVAVTLVNQSHEPAAVHWHGIELESFADGVPGWSGDGRGTLPHIFPGDSLTVRFTPPRAGTFMYHSHANELQQISSGMYGPLIVVDSGNRLPEHDRVLMFSDGGPMISFLTPRPPFLLNGRLVPDTLRLRAGVAHRLRLLNISGDSPVVVTLTEGDAPVMWRRIAKDGATLPAAQSLPERAKVTLAPGEIVDAVVRVTAARSLQLRYVNAKAGPVAQRTVVPVVVRP